MRDRSPGNDPEVALMAIYHLHAQVISRSAGRCATAAAAYRAGEYITDERTGLHFDFRKKRGVAHRGIYLPQNAPSWANSRVHLWNEAERAEKRRDAQLARELNIALPIELALTQNIRLIERFVQDAFVSQGMIADVCVHNAKGNPHAHVMLTMREITPAGFGKKRRDWNDTEKLEQWRKQWADHCNRQLKLAGNEARIDHRTLISQGIDRAPTVHEGPKVRAMRFKREQAKAAEQQTTSKEENTMTTPEPPMSILEREAIADADASQKSANPHFFISASPDKDKQELDAAITQRGYEANLNKWLEPFSAVVTWFKSNLGMCWRIQLPKGCLFDYGSQIKLTHGNWDELRAVMTMVIKKNWPGIRITGSKGFAARAYLQAILAGLPRKRIEGYQPTSQEEDFALGMRIQIVEARREGFLKAKEQYGRGNSGSGMSELGQLLFSNILARGTNRDLLSNQLSDNDHHLSLPSATTGQKIKKGKADPKDLDPMR